jgi:hypothetical protein
MKARCDNPNHSRYEDYGGRGITYCDRWADFDNFVEDMGPRPFGTTLDRINSNGNYEPGNCRWATDAQQHNNRRHCVYYEFQGEQLTLAQIAELVGLPYKALHHRVKRGWDFKKATETPLMSQYVRKAALTGGSDGPGGRGNLGEVAPGKVRDRSTDGGGQRE